MFLILGKENFERCKLTLKQLKQMVRTAHDNFFMISDERIYALEDLLSAFGMDDDDDDVDNDVKSKVALAKTPSVDLNQIEFMRTSYGSFNRCKRIVCINNTDDQLALLDVLLPNIHNFNCEKF